MEESSKSKLLELASTLRQHDEQLEYQPFGVGEQVILGHKRRCCVYCGFAPSALAIELEIILEREDFHYAKEAKARRDTAGALSAESFASETHE